MEGDSLQQFRFPRIHTRKTHRWKKMNFTTKLPKSSPVVEYLVASAYERHHLQPETNSYRMHVVRSLKSSGEYLLCHVRRVVSDGHLKEDERTGVQEFVVDGQVDFMSLFSYLHYHCKR